MEHAFESAIVVVVVVVVVVPHINHQNTLRIVEIRRSRKWMVRKQLCVNGT